MNMSDPRMIMGAGEDTDRGRGDLHLTTPTRRQERSVLRATEGFHCPSMPVESHGSKEKQIHG